MTYLWCKFKAWWRYDCGCGGWLNCRPGRGCKS
jgi:hypothetical protein